MTYEMTVLGYAAAVLALGFASGLVALACELAAKDLARARPRPRHTT